jgi:TolB-like protein/Flp pilus assembly protein TadD/tRNA A-37 threonylcarbamoyl transferase component Bud32
VKANPERWQRLKEILADALEQSSLEERTAVLRQSCSGDTALFREAEKLLSHDTRAFEEFAEFASVHLRHGYPGRIGERIGAYVAIRELGRGGMGIVYLAERADGQFEKRVAIKVLKRGTDTDEVLRRFRTERQILANLEHPNVTRLLDAGVTTDGLPYFVMEFIEGTPITEFVQRENVDLRGRLKLFLKICSAVELAHRNHIIHRDIKPGNVLVKSDSEPKLLDFGIAKLLDVDFDDGVTTIAAERRLTPRYAAPEQRAGQAATVATDVYSLGALLQQLLTDTSPCTNSDTEPSKNNVSRRPDGSRLPNDTLADARMQEQLVCQLNRIVARAMQPHPSQRYSSLKDLSDDIERCLNETLYFRALQPAENPAVRSNYRHNRYIAAGVLAVIVIAAVMISRDPRIKGRENKDVGKAIPVSSLRTSTKAVRSIAVLPFEPLGRDVNDERIGLGMADAVIGRLSNLKHLVVLPTSAVSRYKGPANDPLAAGRALGVDAILSGTVQRSGDRVRTTVQLMRVASGGTIWSEKFDQTFTDIFDVQDAISNNVARSLALNLTSDEQKQLAKRYTINAAAYDEYLMGLYFWNTRSKDGLEKAIDHLRRAVEKDPNFALAYALMADCHYLQFYYHYDRRPNWIQNAKAAAEHALLLDDSIAEAHVAVAIVQFYQASDQGEGLANQAGINSLRHALALNPNLAVAHQRYSWSLSASGHLDEAVREMRRAQELDPLSHTNNTALGVTLVFAREYSEALVYCSKAAELAPNEAAIQENLAYAYVSNGMYQEAIEHYRKEAELVPENKGDVLAMIATVLVSAGRKSEADSTMPEILKLTAEGKADPYNIAVLYGARGEKDAAFEWFDKLLQGGPGGRITGDARMIRYDPMLDPLRSDSRFAMLLKRHDRGRLLEAHDGR